MCLKPQIFSLGKIWKSEANGHVYHSGGVSPTICVGQHSGVQPKTIVKMAKIYRIRKLSPRECYRLMGCSDTDIDLMQNYPYIPDGKGGWILPEGMTETEAKKLKISESQQYKLAGNSIVVNVLVGIFTQMFRTDSDALF